MVTLAAASDSAVSAARGGGDRVFVLVHNGFAGGWVWSKTALSMRAAGHVVFTPTLTGLGERAHLAHPGVDLQTHVQDVVAVFDCEELAKVVLVASSSSAMVAAGVAERIPERIARIVYIDTIEPLDGQSWMDLMGPRVSAPLRAAAERFGDGWRVPRSDVSPPRWVAHPLKTVTDPLAVRNPAAARLPRSYVHATKKPVDWFFGLGGMIDAYAAQVPEKGWDMHRIASDHLPQLSAPARLAEILSSLPE